MTWGNKDLVWAGDTLMPRGRKHPRVSIVADDKYPGMWRLRLPNGVLTDMVNRARAYDAARSVLLEILNRQEMPSEAPPMRLSGAGLATRPAASAQRSNHGVSAHAQSIQKG
jgi:hypothetical protein